MKLCDILVETELNWATKATAEYPPLFDRDDNVVLYANIEDIFKHGISWHTLDLNDEAGGKNAIRNRVNNAKRHFLDGKPMDYPQVEYSKWNNSIDFTNGRHRAVAAYQLGHRYMPVFVSGDVEKFKQLVGTL